jgi:hypothetical protein
MEAADAMFSKEEERAALPRITGIYFGNLNGNIHETGKYLLLLQLFYYFGVWDKDADALINTRRCFTRFDVAS